ncbi:Clp protease N-terminal domain-containing protein [Paenarthrobacter aurescens]|uniref:Clp protease N-terminal domain-containing protein n=1 Tax=Paenarthrobacter aurescens TaxID=43663 RepID=UPI0021C1FF2A|nr:Clp protease N-terminal domain-containing protein [Paenarthrobacter aurescens]MCT9868122.1 hypothetical protein [Paenarthrobacter aurescens]
MSKTKRITLGVAAGALALGAGLGATSIATAATTPTPSATSSADSATPDTATPPDRGGRPGAHGHGPGGGQIAAELATKLGVDEAKVTEALKAFREANKPTTPPTEGMEGSKPDRTAQDAALAKSLAEALGVDEAKVTSALEEIRATAQEERAAALKTKLDKAVTDGKLTQAEADAVTKAVEAGVIGGGGR